MSLGAKLALGLVVILATIMGLSLILLTLNSRARMLEDYRSFAIHISDVAEAGLENAMVSRNPSETENVLQAIHGREHIEDVFILDKRGEIKYATDPAQVGRVLSIDSPTCQICHARGALDRPQTIILPETVSGRSLRVARPIHNQPRCQPCHQEPVLGMLLADFSLTDADREVAATQDDLLLWALVTIVGAIVAAIAFVQLMIVRPMRHFVSVTQAVGKGDFSRRVGLPGKDEIGVLSASFDWMVQRVATRTRELEALNAVAATTSQSLNLDKVLQQALAKVCEVAEAAWGVIHLRDESTTELSLAVSLSLPAEVVKALMRLKPGEGFAGQVAETGQPVVLHDPATGPGSEVKGVSLAPLVAVPLWAGGKVIGALAVGGPAQRRFTPEDVSMLRVIGHQVGVAIDNARLHEETERQAITDGLTGLYNWRYFYQALEQELARAVRYKVQASLIILDIDNFKRFNDTYGHQAGDRVLQDAARLVQGLARKVDTVARYGGEEFVLLLPQTDKAGAIALAERILTAARDELGHALAGGEKVTFSAGVATYPADATTPEELVHAADTALYQAKAEGKNRACAAGGEPLH